MRVKIGICGLPNSGKSSFVKLVSQAEVEIGIYPFTTLKASEYAFIIFSPELKELHQLTKTPEVIPDYLIVVDVPGLIRGAHKGEGLGNEFLSYLRKGDVVLEIVRNFFNPEVSHPEGSIDPWRDLLIIEEEIILSEKEILVRNLKTVKKTGDHKKMMAMEKILDEAEPFKRFLDLKDILKEYNLLLTKPWYLLVNGEEIPMRDELKVFERVYFLDIWWELESRQDKSLQTKFESFANEFRKDLHLLEFFTFNERITQSWFIQKGSTYEEAGGLIHSDFKEKIKGVETISLEEFKTIGNWEEAKKLGKIKTKSKNDLVQEHEIILIKI